MRTIRGGFAGLVVVWGCSAVLLAGDRPLVVPFKLYGGYTVVVRGSIGELDRLNIVIDTGAVPTVVDQRIAKKLHLSGGTEGLSVFSSTVQGQRVVLPKVQIGPIRAILLPGLVEDLSFIERGLGMRIDALAGPDVLGRSTFSLNYESRELIFAPPDFAGSSARMEPGLPYAVVHLEARGQSLRLLLDTGAKDTVLFDLRVKGRLPGLRIIDEKVSSNIGGKVRLRQVELSAARLGDATLGNLAAYVMPTPNDPGTGLDGLMAVVSLGAKEVEFDFQHHLVRWR